MSFEVHQHCFVSGPRSGGGYRNGKWDDGKIAHSHPGGNIPHTHPNTGPSFYGYGKPRTTKRPNGEQFEMIARAEEENTFTLVVTGSALVSNVVPAGGKEKSRLVPIGNTPIEALGFPAAHHMMSKFRMKCVVRDERKLAKR